jgi:hypothetical protein
MVGAFSIASLSKALTYLVKPAWGEDVTCRKHDREGNKIDGRIEREDRRALDS